MAYKELYEETSCPICGITRLVRKWTNKSGICRSCAAKQSHPLTILSSDFIRGEQIGKARHTIYCCQECPQCHKPRWMRANLRGAITPSRICYQCAGFNMQQSKKRQGAGNAHWRGGRWQTKAGYIRIYNPEHPRATHRCVFEHILVWERTYNQFLPDGWIIHHLNGIKDDNRPENLFACERKNHSTGTLREALQNRIRELEQGKFKMLLEKTVL